MSGKAILSVYGGTANCFVCGEPSTSYTGHMHLNDETVLLGWCETHSIDGSQPKPPGEPHCTGCYGRIWSAE